MTTLLRTDHSLRTAAKWHSSRPESGGGCPGRQSPGRNKLDCEGRDSIERNESEPDLTDVPVYHRRRDESSVKGAFTNVATMRTSHTASDFARGVVASRMNAIVVCLLLLPFAVVTEDAWSPQEGDGSFEPTLSVLEEWSGLNDRNDKVMKKPDRYIVNRPPKEPPQYYGSQNKEVTETDLFLLGAIEKLAHRVEFLEKRLTRTEEMLYRLVSGSHNDEVDPCPEGFRRYGENCYFVSGKEVNWKSASSTCRNMRGTLLEFETEKEEKSFTKALLSDHGYRGKNFWTGGLNPGLLWIWSNSAKPIISNSTETGVDKKTIEGNGRCLLLEYRASTKTYGYRGVDCAVRNFYVCRFLENSIGRKLERLQRNLRFENITQHN